MGQDYSVGNMTFGSNGIQNNGNTVLIVSAAAVVIALLWMNKKSKK